MASGGGGVRAGGNQASMEHGGERNGWISLSIFLLKKQTPCLWDSGSASWVCNQPSHTGPCPEGLMLCGHRLTILNTFIFVFCRWNLMRQWSVRWRRGVSAQTWSHLSCCPLGTDSQSVTSLLYPVTQATLCAWQGPGNRSRGGWDWVHVPHWMSCGAELLASLRVCPHSASIPMTKGTRH